MILHFYCFFENDVSGWKTHPFPIIYFNAKLSNIQEVLSFFSKIGTLHLSHIQIQKFSGVLTIKTALLRLKQRKTAAGDHSPPACAEHSAHAGAKEATHNGCFLVDLSVTPVVVEERQDENSKLYQKRHYQNKLCPRHVIHTITSPRKARREEYGKKDYPNVEAPIEIYDYWNDISYEIKGE